MTILEDRLTAALAARADLVQPEDLTREPPLSSRRSLLRRPTTYLLAVAACAAAAAVPFVLSGEGRDRPAPPAVTQTPQPPPADVEGADWPKVGGDDGYDVDGDGEEDPVVLRTESGDELTRDPWRVEARLSSGGVYAIVLDGSGWEINPIGPVDLDGDGEDEILYYNGRQTEAIGVLDLVGPVLVDLEVPDDPGIASDPDAEGHLQAWWREGRALYSSRSVEGGAVLGEDSGPDIGLRYLVDVWRWAIVDGVLVAQDEGRQCMDAGTERKPFPCDAESVAALPAFFPEDTRTMGVGESALMGWRRGQVEMTAGLDGPRGDVDRAGDVVLQVTLAGQEYSAPLPAGPEPVVLEGLLAADIPVVLVRQGATYTAFGVREGRLDQLAPAPGTEVSLREGDESAAGTPYETWLGPGGELFTRAALDSSSGAYEVHRWEVQPEGELVAERVTSESGEDRICFDFAAEPVGWSVC